ncbi:hypothetical protein [Rossellomorea sp. DA94]|nr:hypothetical protein [Rossellomorea sp. DA94]WGG45462.1 hypothetical protein P8596_22600 [Rossellomorea sp. DA94]
MKRRFLTILTASIILFGAGGFFNDTPSSTETAAVQTQFVELPGNPH